MKYINISILYKLVLYTNYPHDFVEKCKKDVLGRVLTPKLDDSTTLFTRINSIMKKKLPYMFELH